MTLSLCSHASERQPLWNSDRCRQPPPRQVVFSLLNIQEWPNAHRDDSIQVPSGDRQQFVIKRSLPNWIFAFIVSTIGASNSWKWEILLGKWMQGSNWETLMSSGCCFKNHSSSLTDCQSVDFSKLLRLIISEKMDGCFQLIWNCQHFIYRRNAYSASRFQGNNRSTP